MCNYEAALAYCKTIPSHPGMLLGEAFKNWLDQLLVAVNHPASSANAAPAVTAQKIVIYTDGACKGNPGDGGYAAVMMFGKHTKEVVGNAPNTTNNQMELMACIAGLEMLKKPMDVIIRTDSSYVCDNFKRVEGWKSNNWRNKNNDEIANVDLWQKLYDLANSKCATITFEKVKGHSGDEYNERCDYLASEAAKQVKNNDEA